jgi:predicted nucleic acid-binding Zn ribbon protein
MSYRDEGQAMRRADQTSARQNAARPCGSCGESFQSVRRDAQFCSDACRQRAHRKRRRVRSLLLLFTPAQRQELRRHLDHLDGASDAAR